jgi:hypothetical protein
VGRGTGDGRRPCRISGDVGWNCDIERGELPARQVQRGVGQRVRRHRDRQRRGNPAARPGGPGRVDDGYGQYRVRLQVQQEDVPETLLAYVPVTVAMGKDRVARVRVKVTGARTELELPPMPAEPKSIKFNDLEGVLADVKSVGWRD